MAKKIPITYKDRTITIEKPTKDSYISIRIKGYKSNPECPDDGQILIDTFEGKTRILVWDGNDINPVITNLHKED